MVSDESVRIVRMLIAEFDHLLPEYLSEENKLGRGLYPNATENATCSATSSPKQTYVSTRHSPASKPISQSCYVISK